MPHARRYPLIALFACVALPVFGAAACSLEADDETVGFPAVKSGPDAGAAANTGPGPSTTPGPSAPGSTTPPGNPTTTPPGNPTTTPPTSPDGAPASNPPPTTHPPGMPGCGLPSAAFCETFDAPAGIGNRSGQLNGTIWGVSRLTGNTNFGGPLIGWPATTLETCNGPQTVRAPNDIIICNGQLRQASNDNANGGFDAGTVTVLAMYPKQPFDWTGRTGTIVFDVSDDSLGTHSAWPEIWVSDKPVPAPFRHFSSWASVPQFGWGIRLASCPLGGPGVGVDSFVVVNDWVPQDTADGTGNLSVTNHACLTPSTGLSQMNHFEIKVSQSQIDVYGTDGGTTAPLKHLSTLNNANLGLSRGLVWLEDVHYNADKGPAPSQREHTWAWDNVGFDGPFTYRDLAFDAPDNTDIAGDGSTSLGKASIAGASSSWSVPDLPASPTAEVVRVLFNVYHYDAPAAFNVTVNGHAHQVPWMFPETQGFTFRTVAVTIPITDLVTGTNTVEIGGSNQGLITSNVDIVLVNVTQ